MQATALSVVAEIFKARKPGEHDTQMWRVYLADHRGRVGYLYSSKEVAAGDVVEVGLAERDGKLRACILHQA